MISKHRFILSAASVVIALLALPGRAEAAASPTSSCGFSALMILLRLEGIPTDPEALRSRLPPLPPGGYSMQELRDVARRCGLRLTGVRLPKSERAIDRPMVIFLRRGRHGHFLVLRPVGHTGKLVQMIDPNSEPVVLDATRLFASPEWTGLALIPGRPIPSLRIAGGTFLAIAVAGCCARQTLQRLAAPSRTRTAWLGLRTRGRVGAWFRGMEGPQKTA